jgi:hypothetical protein
LVINFSEAAPSPAEKSVRKENRMTSKLAIRNLILTGAVAASMYSAKRALAAGLKGEVLGAGAPIAYSTVTLWQASADAPIQIA